MISIENTQFTEINNSDLNLVNGGAIGVGMACLIIGAAVIKTAWYGFLAGCAYELILG